jgi:multidrug efflux pump subunit AcrA (membrane-fusion protein)
MRKTSIALAAVGLLALAAAIWVLNPTGGQAQEQAPDTPPVTVAASRGAVQQTITAPGIVVGTREWWVTAGEGGLLVEVSVRPGDLVQAGQSLATIDAGLEGQNLFQPTAPFEGVILEVAAIPGAYLPPHATLLRLSDPRAVEIQTTVIEEDLPLVRVDQDAELYFDAYLDVVPGVVARVVPQRVPGEARPLYHVYLTPQEVPDDVLPGMTADAAIIIDRVDDALRLPKALLRFIEPDSAGLQVWRDGGIETRTVQTGLRGDVYVEIVDGVQEGEEVIGQ